MKALRKNSKDSSNRALPITLPKLKKIIECLDAHAHFSAFSTDYIKASICIAWVMWLRIDELFKLCFEDIRWDLETPLARTPYLTISIHHRKSDKDEEERLYEIHPMKGPNDPVCAYCHVTCYYKSYRRHRGRYPTASDFVFPRIVGGKKGFVHGKDAA